MYQHTGATMPSAAPHQPTHEADGEDMYLVLSPAIAAYLLGLLARDLRRGPRSAAAGMEEDATALAMFLHDNIDEQLRTPVPPLPARVQHRAAVQVA